MPDSEKQEFLGKIAQLEVQNTILQQFMESAADAFYVFDANLYFIEVNKTATIFLQRSREELIGKHILEIDPYLEESGRYDLFRQVLKTGNGIRHTLSDWNSQNRDDQNHASRKGRHREGTKRHKHRQTNTQTTKTTTTATATTGPTAAAAAAAAAAQHADSGRRQQQRQQ